MGCTLCHSGSNQEHGIMCIPENGPILPVLYDSLHNIRSSRILYNSSGMQPPHVVNCLETSYRQQRYGTWCLSPRRFPGQLPDERSVTESTYYESTTTSGSNAPWNNVSVLTMLEYSSLDIVRRKSYLKHLLFEIMTCFKSDTPIISNIVNFTVSLEYCDLVFLEVLSASKGTVVFRAKRRDRTDSYAVKCVEKEKVMNADREYSLLSSLPPHPFLIAMTNSGRIATAGHNFLVLEVVGEGINLYHRVRQLGGMRSNEVKFYAVELVAALSFLHSHGYLHRDVSLKNILLTSKGHLKLSDFDQCCRIGLLTEPGFYERHPFSRGLAPEQTRMEIQSEYADFWQLGWNLVWMRTGTLPKQIIDIPDIKPRSLEVLCKSLLTEDVAERKRACLGNIKALSYFDDVDWEPLLLNPPEPPVPPPHFDRRMDKASETIYYTSIYEFLNE